MLFFSILDQFLAPNIGNILNNVLIIIIITIIIITRRMAIANGMCVSFCNQSKAHFGLPWVRYALGTIAVNVTWMKRGFNACQTHCSMYPSIFNHFPVIQPVSSKVRHFSTFWPPEYTPGTIAVNVTWMERGFNADQMHSSIYPSIFNCLWTIARYWSEIATFSFHLNSLTDSLCDPSLSTDSYRCQLKTFLFSN